MIHGTLRVKTFGRTGDWGYRVVSPGGATLASRRAFTTEGAARNAGWAAADALAPVSAAIRLTRETRTMPRPQPYRAPSPKPTFWRSLFG
jgi:hypothetical protein